MAAYLTRDFFAQSYFRQVDPVVSARDLASGPTTDREVFEEIVGRLGAGGAFAAVAFPSDPRSGIGSGLTADLSPSAAVAPGGWSEAEDAAGGGRLRTVAYAIALEVREVDPGRAYARLDGLANRVQNLIDGSDLGGRVLAGLSRLGRGWPDPKADPPWTRLVLEGTFTYAVPAADGRGIAP